MRKDTPTVKRIDQDSWDRAPDLTVVMASAGGLVSKEATSGCVRKILDDNEVQNKDKIPASLSL